MPKKKKGKKGKKEKKKTPHQLQVEALTRACDEAERVYRDTRDLNARLSRENEERRLTLAEKRALADEQAELFECSERQDARERKQQASSLKHEKTLLQAQVEQLRLQRERRTELYLENETLEGDLDTASGAGRAAGIPHGHTARAQAARRMAGSAACGPPREPQRNCTRHGSGSIAVRGAGVVADAKPAGRHLAVEGIRRLR